MSNSTLPYEIVKQLLNFGLLVEAILPFPDVTMKNLVFQIMEDRSSNPARFNSSLDTITLGLKKTHDPSSTNETAFTLLSALSGFLKTTGTYKKLGEKSTNTYIILSVVTLVVVILRFCARYYTRVRKEDWALLVAYILSLTLAILMSSTVRFGHSGLHIWDLSYNMARTNLKWLYFCEVCFPLCLWVLKIALLIFYWGIIPNRVFHMVLVATYIIISSISIGGIALTIFQCKPVNFWDDPLEAKCVNRERLWTAWAICSISSDFFMWFLPMPVIWRLQKLQLREKLVIIGMFAIGAFVCVASINRLVSVNKFISDPDHTYKEGPSGIWSLLEIDLTIMITCVPALKILIMRFMPQLVNPIFKHTRSSQSNDKGSDGSKGPSTGTRYATEEQWIVLEGVNRNGTDATTTIDRIINSDERRAKATNWGNGRSEIV